MANANVSSDIEGDSEIPLIKTKNNVGDSILFKLNIRIAPIVFIFTSIIFVIRDANVFVASDLCESLHLTYSEFGIGTSLFTFAYVIFLGPGSILLNKLQTSKALALVSFTSGTSSIMIAFAQNKYYYYIFRFFVGVFQAGITPVAYNYIGLTYPKKYSLFVYGMFISATQFARPIGAIIAMIFLAIGDDWFFGLFSWQLLFLIEGIFGCLYCFIPLFLLPDNACNYKHLTFEERNWLKNELESQKDEENKEKTEFKSSLYRIFKNKKFWVVTIADGLSLVSYTGLLSFITLIISEMLGGDKYSGEYEEIYSETCANSSNSALASILASIPYFFSGIFSVLVGLYGKYIKNLPLFMCFAYLMSSVFIILWIFMQEYLIIGMIIITFSIVFGSGAFGVIFKLLEDATDKKDRLLAFSSFATIALFGAIIGPIIVGIVVDMFGFNAGMIVMAICLWISALLVYFIKSL